MRQRTARAWFTSPVQVGLWALASFLLAVSLTSNWLKLRYTYFEASARPADLFNEALDDTARILLCLGGLFILWRGSSRSSFILALALIGMSPFPVELLPSRVDSYLALQIGVQAGLDILPALLAWFAIRILSEMGLQVPAWARPLLLTCFVGSSSTFLLVTFFPVGQVWHRVTAVAQMLVTPLVFAGFALSFVVLAAGLRIAKADTRRRLSLLITALALVFAPYLIFIDYALASESLKHLMVKISIICRFLGTLLFAYAILRHRVIDLGFTLNRTLVYGGVSIILLTSFGVAEWALGQFFAAEGWQNDTLLSAGLAVAIVLAFHPVTRFVEHQVSTIFFRPWRDQERALRRVVQEGAFFTDAAQLAARFSDALEEFCGAPCHLYRLAEDNSYVCSSSAAHAVPADDPTAVTLRAFGKSAPITEGSAVRGSRAFAMIQGLELQGFVAVGAKPYGERLRPDEITLIEWATHEVGHYVHVLRVAQLKSERDSFERRVELLAERNAELFRVLTARGEASIDAPYPLPRS